MSKARNIADLLDANGDVALGNLDNVPAADLVNDTSPQLGGDLASNGNDINFGDGDKAQFGASNDLQIYHDGNNSFINDLSGTGDLYIRGSSRLLLQDDVGDSYVVGNKDASVDLYYDNAKKLATTSTGIDVTGDISLGTNISAKKQVRFNKSLNNSSFTTIATVNGTSLTSGVDLVLQGTGSNGVVVNTTFHILVNHAGDIYIESRNTFYSPVSIKIVSNGNEDFAIEAKYHGGSTPETITCVLEAHNNETIVQASSHSYTSTTLEHYAEDGVTQNFTGTSSIGNYFKKDNTTVGRITWDGNHALVGTVLQVTRTNGNINSPNTSVTTSWVEPTSSARTPITLKSTNPYLKVTLIPGAEMDGSDDRLFLRFDSSKNGGSYSKFGREFFLGVKDTGSIQGNSGALIAYEQVTGSAGDTFTFTFKHRAEIGGRASIEYGQNFAPHTSSNTYCYFIIEEIAS